MDFRKESNFYFEVSKLGTNRIFGIILYKFIIGLLTSGVVIARVVKALFNVAPFIEQMEPTRLSALIISEAFSFSIANFVLVIIASVFSFLLSMEVLNSLKTGSFKIGNTFKHLNEKPVEIAGVSAIYALAVSLLGYFQIPFLSLILEIFVSLALIYLPYLLLEKKLSILDYFKESYNLTIGQKLEIFKVRFRYGLIRNLPVGFALFLLGISVVSRNIALSIFAGLIVLFSGLFAIYIAATEDIALAYYYQKHKEYEESFNTPEPTTFVKEAVVVENNEVIKEVTVEVNQTNSENKEN